MENKRKIPYGERLILIGIAAVSAAAQGALGFSHEMPKGTNEKPLDTPYAEMAETFRNPFDKVQTGCYWYWMDGNISCDGARKDLEAMKKAGIDRPYIGDIGFGRNKKGPVKTLSPEWNEVLQTAFSTASRLGIEIGIFNSPGWSQSGGPWVKPEMAMRRVVLSVVVVEGPADGVVLPAPKFECAPQEDMRDVCAIAYPVPKGLDGRLEKRAAKDAALEVAKDKPLVVELASPEPFEAQSAEIVLASGKGCGEIIVEAETDGAWKRICKMPYSRSNHGPGVGFAPHAPIFAAFAPTTARKFRVTVSTTRKDKGGFASVAVCAAPRVERAVEKSLGKMYETPLPMWREYKWPVEMECAEGTALDPSKAVVLTGKVAPDGKLDWKVPAGTWAIYRIACAPTGTKNGPANPEATGYEVDKMSREHIAAHFDAYLGKILEATPPESRKAIRHAVLDSYEQGGQNFTDHFAEKFKASFGYDPTPYLPVLHGTAVGSRADSDRFLWDLRRFVADEVAYSYVGGLRKASNAHGMETWLECYGHWGFPGEFLQYGGQSDGIAGEYRCEGSLGNIENRAASSCAHIYGRRLVWAESNTSGGKWFQRGPMDMKQRTDRFFAEGLNATILHVYIQQESDRKPGRIAWFGNEFNRHNSWFGHFDLFTGYLKRCGWMLRQGLNVADVAYFIGEDAPCMTGVCDPALPAGRQFDYINAEVLTETARVDEKGRIVLPHGTAYEVLVLPKLDTMRPKMAECVERLVNAGATVIGPHPVRSPSLAGQPESDAKVREIAERLWGGGKISASMTLEEALAKRKSEPDVVFDAKRKLAYAHRTMPKAEIYFISNQSGEAIPSVDVSFRVAGRPPELWDTATGESRAAGNWREDKGRTSVTLSLAKHESVFVVFPRETGKGKGFNPVNPVNPVKNDLRVGPWTVEFESDGLHRGPKEPVKFDKLIDLSTSGDPAIKYYSGKLVYRTKFDVPSSLFPLSSSLSLDLGEVSVTAKVKVNGKDAGGVCFAPYRLDIAPFVKAGENDLEIEVCNLWVNRLVGDDGDPNRPTWTSQPCADKKRTKLHKSGLLGPVSIQYRTAEKVDVAKTAAALGGAPAGPLDSAWLKGTTDRNPLSYKPGEEMVFTIAPMGIEGDIPDGEYDLVWKKTDDFGATESGKVPFTKTPFVYKTRIGKPGFVRLQAHVADKTGKRYEKKFDGDATTPEGKRAMNAFERAPKKIFFDGGAGADVALLCDNAEPDDFDAFWAGQFARLDKVPVKADLIETKSGNPKTRMYAVRIDCAGLRPVTGYLSIPKDVENGAKYPCRLETHGYSGDSCVHVRPQWKPHDEIVLNINAHGLKLEEFGATEADTKALRTEIRSNGKRYAFDPVQNEDPETAYFNGMVLRVKRALQYLKTLDGWNGKDLRANGGSQAGLQTIWAAACGEGVTLANTVAIWCCDMETNASRAERKASGDGWYVPWTPSMGYYDAVNWAKRIPQSCRTNIMRAGLGDYTCPPRGLAKLYNNIKGNKSIKWVQGSTHGYRPPDYEGRDFETQERADDETQRK